MRQQFLNLIVCPSEVLTETAQQNTTIVTAVSHCRSDSNCLHSPSTYIPMPCLRGLYLRAT